MTENFNQLPKKIQEKILRNYRRAGRTAFDAYKKQLEDTLKGYEAVIRKRPKFFPKKLWTWLSNIFINVETLQNMTKIDMSKIPTLKNLEELLDEVDA